jgi:uncharacterized membrane protein
MAFCANCGKAVDGRFCQNCGTPLAEGVPTGAPGSTSVPPPPMGQASAQSGLQENVACALCYALGLITGILFLAIAPYNLNPKIKFHAFQAIFFHLSFIALFIVTVPLGLMLPFPLSMIVWFLRFMVWLGGVGAWLFLMWKAYNNERVELPIIGPLAAQQAGN